MPQTSGLFIHPSTCSSGHARLNEGGKGNPLVVQRVVARLQTETVRGEMINEHNGAMQQGGREREGGMPSPLHPTLPVREHSGPPCPASPGDPATPRSQCLPEGGGGEGRGQQHVQEQSRQGDLPRPQQHALSLPAGAPSAQLLLPSIQSASAKTEKFRPGGFAFSNDLRFSGRF